jgi:hypothetical protein
MQELMSQLGLCLVTELPHICRAYFHFMILSNLAVSAYLHP